MRKIALLLYFCFFGCAYINPGSSSSFSFKKFNGEPLPPDPSTEPLPNSIPDSDWVEPISIAYCVDEEGVPSKEATVPCPDKDGFFISEARAARDALYRTRYKELRLNYMADQKAWATQQVLLEDRLKEAADYASKAQPNWMERHSFELGVLSGAVLGIGMTIGVVYGVEKATK